MKNAYLLSESLKKSFVSDKIDSSKLSNNPDLLIKTKVLSDDPFGGSIMVDGTNQTDEYSYDFSGGLDKFSYQNKVIESYRNLASDPEVSNAIDIIVNEIVYTVDKDVFKINIDEENEKISEVINESFKDILDIINVKENIYNISRQAYIDGQLNVSLSYANDKKKGIRIANIIEPLGLYFDSGDAKWKYNLEDRNINTLYNNLQLSNENEFTESEMVHVDFGLYSKITQENQYPFLLNLGYLEGVGANMNMLKTLENMLIPMRYSRSVSRRLFNIDVADLPPKQAKEIMSKIRAEFRYKKTYDPKTGTIKNIKNTQPLVEDYWLANRSGAKGTSVDTMDEKGSAMDLEDIKHAAKKLYTSMKIPDEMNPYSDDPASFSFDDTQISQNYLKFYIFVSRLRVPITKMIKEILRRQLVSKGVFKDSEWNVYEKKIEITFTADSIFLENMQKEIFLKNLEAWVTMKENVGEIISLETAIKKTFGWSTEQLNDELQKIEDEKDNITYKAFYDRDEEGDTPGGSWRS